MKNKKVKIAIVEDDSSQNKVLTNYVSAICEDKAYENVKFDIKSYTKAQQCIMDLENDLDIILIDYYLLLIGDPDVLTGEDIVDCVKSFCPSCDIVMISSQEDKKMLTKLIRKGITEYIDKNKNLINRVESVVQRLLLRRELSAA
ncbi:MAG: response regulator of citrate/malate metabolism [Bacteroidia bacterium]|jgi:response regulator of citrate/malate metabolism|tara:strand:+ start:4511 stop:4945 length:435 start_codon:yes stop_codon:yes gene_type:complete